MRRRGRHKTTVPNTVVGTLVDDKTYPDPMVGTNLKGFPGMNYSAATFLRIRICRREVRSNVRGWWRNEFVLPAAVLRRRKCLHSFSWHQLPGERVVQRAENCRRAGRRRNLPDFEFDLTKYARPGANNVIALEITAPAKEDLGITWVDWNPTPADKNLGIWKEVSVYSERASGDSQSIR